MSETVTKTLSITESINLSFSAPADLPPEMIPKAEIAHFVEDESWGTARIFKLKLVETSLPSASSEVLVQPISRKFLMSKLMLAPSLHRIEDKEAEEDDDQDEIFWCLHFFPAAMISTILEDVITQIRILIECNNTLRIMKTVSGIGLLKAIKYGVEQKLKTDELAGITTANLHCEEYKLNKLESDRNTMMELITSLYTELAINQCYSELLRFTEDIILRNEHKDFLIEDEARNKVKLKDILRQLRQQRNHHKTVIYESESIIAGLQSNIEDAVLLTETKGRYVDNWQAARTEQHVQVIHEKETISTSSTENYKQKTEHEQRVHLEVESLTNIIIDETLKDIQNWMDKYETDMEKIDLKIQIQKNEYQNMHDKRRDMERTYNKHDRQMREWNTFKEERAKARLYAETMEKSALTVQAWWRGLLVRKQLGPYRPKKKRKK